MRREAVASAVARYFGVHAGRYGLGAGVRVESQLNWGGFGNLHFVVEDEVLAYHVKLSSDRKALSRLERWRGLSSMLETRYRAPAVVDGIELEEASLSGLILERCRGAPLSFGGEPGGGLVPEVLALLDRLHADEDLARYLRDSGIAQDARASAVEHYVDHLEADLAESGERYPVDGAVLAWMRRELSRLRRRFEGERALEHVSTVPIHGDLWTHNIVVDPREEGGWHVIDWDDLTLGDPAIDFCTFLWPLWRDGANPSAWDAREGQEPGLTKRLELYRRAALLDEVIDSLADWVEAERMPEHRERVRSAKLQVHERALADYRRLYGEG